MIDIEIKTIPHDKQRYNTIGDYFQDRGTGTQRFRVSEIGNKDYEFLVALHELIEQHLTEKRGITEESITFFDEKYESERKQGLHGPYEEPGFDPNSPYIKEHTFATKIEKLMAEELGIKWEEYEFVINSL